MWLRWLFFGLVVKPLIFFIIGLNIRHRERLPKQGPAIIVANHNSHLDTLVLMSLFPLKPGVRPVAAADYFLSNRLLAWFALKVIGIIPLTRKVTTDPFQAIHDALSQQQILILFPEGTRGEPEKMSKFKNGIARLAQAHPDIAVTPIFLHGLGKSLPKGEIILVPFFCDVFVGEPLIWGGNKHEYMQRLEMAIQNLADEWE